jgi:hypothetical protein
MWITDGRLCGLGRTHPRPELVSLIGHHVPPSGRIAHSLDRRPDVLSARYSVQPHSSANRLETLRVSSPIQSARLVGRSSMSIGSTM